MIKNQNFGLWKLGRRELHQAVTIMSEEVSTHRSIADN
jgi:hypothetical protein